MTPPKLTQRIRTIRDTLLSGLVERDVSIRLALIAALAGEHLLLIGPPGTAKSLIARRLRLAFAGATYFERLLTRFTVPEELFGPLSIKALEQDRYERLIDAYLPSASIVFLDEIFKANSAILNALLTLLNEREFDNGTTRIKTPLIAVIGASNELPGEGELAALFDRFLLRLQVCPVSQEAFPELLQLRDEHIPEMATEHKLGVEELAEIQNAALEVKLGDDVVALLCDLRQWCIAENIAVSDRRWRKIVKLLQVAALTNGRPTVSVWDCWLLQHCLGNMPEDQGKVYDWYAARVGASAAMDPSRLTRIVVSWEATLKKDKESRSQRKDEKGRPLYKGIDGKPVTSPQGKGQAKRNGEPLFLAPSGACSQTGYYSSRHTLKDRTNNGKGFTEEELNRLYIKVRNGRIVNFENWSNRDSYLADRNNWLTEEIELPALLEPTPHKKFYIEGCLREIDQLRAEVGTYRDQVETHIEEMQEQIRNHLWVTADFVDPAATSLKQTLHEVNSLLARIDKLRKGFALLPQETVNTPSRS